MNVYMTDNERGQSIPVVWDNGVYVLKRTWRGKAWQYFPHWDYPLREPTSIHEIAMMMRLGNG